jgi:hypothetical protein
MTLQEAMEMFLAGKAEEATGPREEDEEHH